MNQNEVDIIRTNSPAGCASTMNRGISRMTPTDAKLATSDATAYFQTADTTGAIPKWMGRPAYQNAGITRIQ